MAEAQSKTLQSTYRVMWRNISATLKTRQAELTKVLITTPDDHKTSRSQCGGVLYIQFTTNETEEQECELERLDFGISLIPRESVYPGTTNFITHYRRGNTKMCRWWYSKTRIGKYCLLSIQHYIYSIHYSEKTSVTRIIHTQHIPTLMYRHLLPQPESPVESLVFFLTVNQV